MYKMKPTVHTKEDFSLYISEQDIKKRIAEMAADLNRDFRDRTPIFIGILNGAFIFMSDLIREITIDCEIDFLKLSSYGDAKISSGNVTLLKDLNCDVRDRDIVIVEDIVDSGLSIAYIRELIIRQNPRSFSIVTLLYKKSAAKIDFPLEYVGFEIPTKFVIGYGLDYAQQWRNLKSIYVLDSSSDGSGSAARGDT
jgi:hypoxanthine phosphoribosyltransferase